jgi:alkylation response protein AidB-like acyl-CoA dehydrogenase
MKDNGENINMIASMAKLYASEIATKATNEAVQIHGGYGYIKEFPVEKLYRDVKLMTIGEGTSEVQRMIIAKNILSLFD